MFPLYEKLASANDVERQDKASSLVSGIHDSDEVANWEFRRLVETVLSSEFDSDNDDLASAECSGGFSAYDAVSLLASTSRTSGYFRAIGEAKPFGSAIDAGPGPGGILAIAATVMHGAKVDAYEVNHRSVLCARRIVELLGLKNRITIHEENVFSANLDRAEVGITDTFGRAITGGKQKELGAKMVARLAEVCDVVIPRYALIHAKDVPIDFMEKRGTGWRPVTWVDMSKPVECVEGRLKSGGGGVRQVRVYSELHAAKRTPVLCRRKEDGVRIDDILSSIELGLIEANQGDLLGFRYWISPDESRPPEIWNETTGAKAISIPESSLSAVDNVPSI